MHWLARSPKFDDADRALAPLRPGPRRTAANPCAHPSPQIQAARPARRSMDLHLRCPRVREQRTPRHPGRQPGPRPRCFRSSTPRRAARWANTPGSSSGPASRDDLRRPGSHRQRIGRRAALRRRTTGPFTRDLSDLVGGQLDAERGIPHPLGRDNVRFHNTGVKHFHHPGRRRPPPDLLAYNRLTTSPRSCDAFMIAEPGSRSEDALRLELGGPADAEVGVRDRPREPAQPARCAA